jgi:hypothetical protein
MRTRSAIAAVAIFALLAFVSTVSPVSACGDKAGAKATGVSMGSGCPMGKSADKAGCAGQAKGGCSQHAGGAAGGCGMMGAGACCPQGGGQQCSMSPADCEKMLRTYYENHGWLGLEMACAKEDDVEPTVTRVIPGSPAEKAGFKVGDTLVAVNGIAYGPESMEAIQKLMSDGMKVGDKIAYKIVREGKSDKQIKTKLVRIPDTVLAQMVSDHVTTAHKSEKAESAKS